MYENAGKQGITRTGGEGVSSFSTPPSQEGARQSQKFRDGGGELGGCAASLFPQRSPA